MIFKCLKQKKTLIKIFFSWENFIDSRFTTNKNFAIGCVKIKYKVRKIIIFINYYLQVSRGILKPMGLLISFLFRLFSLEKLYWIFCGLCSKISHKFSIIAFLLNYLIQFYFYEFSEWQKIFFAKFIIGSMLISKHFSEWNWQASVEWQLITFYNHEIFTSAACNHE